VPCHEPKRSRVAASGGNVWVRPWRSWKPHLFTPPNSSETTYFLLEHFNCTALLFWILLILGRSYALTAAFVMALFEQQWVTVQQKTFTKW
jgi:hypothetical protein